MGIMDTWHSFSDLNSKKHERRRLADESAAKVTHAKSEAGRIDADAAAKLAAIQAERDRFNHQVLMDHERTRHELYKLNRQSIAMNHAMKTGADFAIDGVQVRYRRAPVSVTEEQPAAIPAALPGRIDFIDVLESWRPSQQQILLGLKAGGDFVTVPSADLCHVALAGATGGGKSVLMRLLLSQLLFVGCKVLIADPHFTQYDRDKNEDWRPIADRLMIEPAINGKQIEDVLKWMAASEIPKRLERRRRGELVGNPCFLAMDEYPAICRYVPDAPDYVSAIAQEGRKCNLFLIASAQDFLVKTIRNSNVRDNFRTCVYVGGDQTSGRVLLDVKGNPDDGSLGKGIVLSRSQAMPTAQHMRVPFVSNESLYRLLGVNSGESVNDSVNGVDEPVEPMRSAVNGTVKYLPEAQSKTRETFTPAPFGVTEKQLDQIRLLHEAEIPLREICRLVKLDGRHYGAFKEALKYLHIKEDA